MQIKEISIAEFENFARNHPLSSMHQTSEYAKFKAQYGYDYDCIGFVDNDGTILAAGIMLHKKIGLFIKYGYAPKGFLVDYYNKGLLNRFTSALRDYYYKKGFAFIKINPEIAIGEIDYKNKYEIAYNQNRVIIDYLEDLGYKKLKRATQFESMLPIFNAILPLKNYDIKGIDKKARNKLHNSFRKGLFFELGNRDNIDIIHEFIKRKKLRDNVYYKELYNVFSKTNDCDIFLVSLNYNEYLHSAKLIYEKELQENNRLNEKVKIKSDSTLINRKMASDKALNTYHENLIEATKGASKHDKNIYVAGAITVKHGNRVNIYISGYDKKHENLNPNYFLHYNIIEFYKNSCSFIDLNGISGDFTKENKYHGLNQFKVGFKPKVYEFIGEFDLVVNESKYNTFLMSSHLIKKYNKNK